VPSLIFSINDAIYLFVNLMPNVCSNSQIHKYLIKQKNYHSSLPLREPIIKLKPMRTPKASSRTNVSYASVFVLFYKLLYRLNKSFLLTSSCNETILSIKNKTLFMRIQLYAFFCKKANAYR